MTSNLRLLSFALATSSLSLFGAGEARAGFFDFVFSPPPAYAPAQQPGLGQSYGPRQTVIIRSAPSAVSRPEPRAAATTTAIEHADRHIVSPLEKVLQKSGPMAAFAKDATLRSGDIVVTDRGISVFEGQIAERHESREFLPLSRSFYRGRPELAALERASGFRPRVVAAVAAPSAARELTVVKKREPAREVAKVVFPAPDRLEAASDGPARAGEGI